MLRRRMLGVYLAAAIVSGGALARPAAAEDWLQFKYDAHHSGNVPQRAVDTATLGLAGAVAATDAIFTAPVVADGRVYVVDGSGVALCIDAKTLAVIWKTATAGGAGNCNNVSSPAIVGRYLHFGTTAGTYYVLDRADGSVVRRIACGDPIFSTPVVSHGRAYFATLGARVYAVEPDGAVAWQWDFVKEVLEFDGDRWSGQDWLEHKKARVTWRDHFVCSRDMAVHGKTLVIPAGGRTVFIDDTGDKPALRAVGLIPNYAGNEYPAAFGQSIGQDGAVYVQWHRRDNAGRVEVLRLGDDNKVAADFVHSTQTSINLPGSLSFSAVSVRGQAVYRTRPEQGYGFCRHTPDDPKPQPLGGYPSIASPILLRDQAVLGGLDGAMYVVPITGQGGGKVWSFKTALGCPITAPAAVCDGRIYFGGEDGYLYVLAPGGKAAAPVKDLGVANIRTPLAGKFADPKYDWATNYGSMGNTNANDQGLAPPLKMKWMRRVEGTVKHIPVCGGGRVYTHTAEGQIMAVEEQTGRLLWRRYWPGVYLSFTAPIYHDGKLLVPQAGMSQSRVRCLDAATGRLLWEAPFTGSPSWSRQGPPVIQGNLAIYASGDGQYAPQGTEKAFTMSGSPKPAPDQREVSSWIYSHNNPFYTKDNHPTVWAWDMTTGKLAWKRDFSNYGRGGNDCGLCLMDGKLYYSTFFGYASSQRRRRGLPDGPNGITAAIDPVTGKTLWMNTAVYVTAGCTLSGRDGRLYLGGYNPAGEGDSARRIRCLDARDGSLIWQSDKVATSVNVITVTDQFLFSNAIRGDGHIIDKATGKIIGRFNNNYNCTRFTYSAPYLIGANVDLVDLSQNSKLVSTGPAIDSRECLGSAVSNGRIFYTSQASGMQVSMTYGDEAKATRSPWEPK